MYDTLDEQLRLCFDGTLKIVRDSYTRELKLWNEDTGIWVLVSDEFKKAYPKDLTDVPDIWGCRCAGNV
jgi:hypothetical protein